MLSILIKTNYSRTWYKTQPRINHHQEMYNRNQNPNTRSKGSIIIVGIIQDPQNYHKNPNQQQQNN